MITITLNKIMAHNPCKDGINRLLKLKGKPSWYQGDDIEFPMSNILDSNILEDCLWAMRCLPEHASLWRKFALWCGSTDVKHEQCSAAMDAYWSAKFATGRIDCAMEVLTVRDEQAEKLRQILTALAKYLNVSVRTLQNYYNNNRLLFECVVSGAVSKNLSQVVR